MSTDKSSRTRKPGTSRSINENPLPSDPTGTDGNERTQVLSLLTGGSNEPGATTRTSARSGMQMSFDKHLIETCDLV